MPLDAAASTFGTPGQRLLDAQLCAPSPTARKVWASLDAESRCIILGHPLGSSTTPSHGSRYYPRLIWSSYWTSTRHTILHETWMPTDDSHDPYDLIHPPDPNPPAPAPNPSTSLMAASSPRGHSPFLLVFSQSPGPYRRSFYESHVTLPNSCRSVCPCY